MHGSQARDHRGCFLAVNVIARLECHPNCTETSFLRIDRSKHSSCVRPVRIMHWKTLCNPNFPGAPCSDARDTSCLGILPEQHRHCITCPAPPGHRGDLASAGYYTVVHQCSVPPAHAIDVKTCRLSKRKSTCMLQCGLYANNDEALISQTPWRKRDYQL